MTELKADDYLFDTGSDLGGDHVALLEGVFDDPTFEMLEGVDVQPGQRCLDVGAGGGSVARWLAERVGPTGRAIAVDIDTSCLDGVPGVEVPGVEMHGVEVHRHDINDGLTGPLAGPYDVIHARILLAHLPRRDAVFAELVDALAPGGWLVVGDLTDRPLSVLSTPRPEDVEVWDRIQHLSHHVVSPAAGIDFGWARRLHHSFGEHDLLNIDGIEWSRLVEGGSPAAMLHANLNNQAHEALRGAAAQEWELARYQELVHDPAFRAWFYQFVCVRGQKRR